MRKTILIVAIVAALISVVLGTCSITMGAVQHNVRKTPHNLTATPVSDTTTTEICIFCHTPHNAVAGKKFLWNRADSAATFYLYTASPTLNFTKSGLQISEISKMCMSCHDGNTAVNSMANPYRAGDKKMGEFWPLFGPPCDEFNDCGPNIGEGDGAGGGGGILTNDHPISFVYSQSTTDSTIKAADVGGQTVGGLPLWDRNGDGVYRLECVTCHDPHVYYGYPGGRNDTWDGVGDKKLRPFLRRSNASSGLCFTCHNK